MTNPNPMPKPSPRTKKTKYWAILHEDLTGWLHKPLSFRSVCGVYVCPLYMNKADAEKDACYGDKVVEVKPVIVAPKSRKRGLARGKGAL